MTEALQLADNNDFADVQVITLKQFLKECAYEMAWEKCTTPHDVEQYAQRLLNTTLTHAKEFVEITPNGIQIGINASEVDDHAIDRAIMLLAEAPSLTEHNLYEFGEQINLHAPQHS